ncbi:response regulator [Chelativorans sp.]|uniref:response regulator n=1 Tax=Chelativorans sp. TaxID=2203393 RepID=UPI002810A673|nr:response regulator [Chelativorans sp.]
MLPEKVLIVEDEALVAAGLELFLEDHGFEIVGWALDGAEAMSLVTRRRPDVALVDIQLRRGEDGIELARTLHEEHGISIVFLTAQSDPATVERAKSVRHRAYIRKPYDEADLLAAIRQDATS